jgi:CheY-like chemotaxis protein
MGESRKLTKEIALDMELNTPPALLLVDDDQTISKQFIRGITNGQTREPEVDSIQLLVTDTQMPRMTGIELAEFVTRARPNCAALLISSSLCLPRLSQGVENS